MRTFQLSSTLVRSTYQNDTLEKNSSNHFASFSNNGIRCFLLDRYCDENCRCLQVKYNDPLTVLLNWSIYVSWIKNKLTIYVEYNVEFYYSILALNFLSWAELLSSFSSWTFIALNRSLLILTSTSSLRRVLLYRSWSVFLRSCPLFASRTIGISTSCDRIGSLSLYSPLNN